MSSTFLFICFLISLAVNTTVAADPVYSYHICPNTSTYTPNSIYQSNLNHLLSVLSSIATGESYYAATAGNDSSTTIYGQFLCRGDMNATNCRDCVQFAVKDAVKRCPIEKETMIWYDECQLRYSNRSFFGIEAEGPGAYLLNIKNITNMGPDRFNLVLEGNLKQAAASAAEGRPGEKKFATKEANFSAFQRLYNLVQCTPDLSSEDCSRCLNNAIGTLNVCCTRGRGARVLFRSCNVRYELYLFYNQTTSESPPPGSIATPNPPSTVVSPPPPGSITTPNGKSKVSSVTIVAIVLSIAVCLILLSLGCCLFRRKAKKKYNDVYQNVVENITTTESWQFDFATIEAATDKFSDDNKLGEGGFGEVYKIHQSRESFKTFAAWLVKSTFGAALLKSMFSTSSNFNSYMAPEYAMKGLYSVKSDVFSFGVLLFEIISGRKNSGFHLMDCAPSLVAYVWKLWNEEKCLDLMDSCLKDSCDPNEFMRDVHIGLLCVQEDAYKRPTMSSVSLMLKSEAPLPQPDRPAFLAGRFSSRQEIFSIDSYTANEITVSEFVPR